MNIYRLLKKPFFGRFQKPWRWPADYPERDRWQHYTFKSKSGGSIAALYGTAAGRARATVVMAHPMGVSAKGYYLKHGHADLYRNNGCNVFLFDFNGFGESTEGDYRLFADIIAAGNMAHTLTPSLPCILHGISFGASMGICGISQYDHPFAHAVFESAFTSLAEFWAPYPLPSFMVNAMSKIMPGKERQMRSIYHAPRMKGLKSILWIYGDKDDQTPVKMGKRFMEAACVASEMLVIKGGKHADCFRPGGSEYSDAIVRYLKASIK